MDFQSRSDVDMPSAFDVEETIEQGMENLQRVGGEMHPLASRYVRSFRQLQTRLQTIHVTASSVHQASSTEAERGDPPSRTGSVPLPQHTGADAGAEPERADTSRRAWHEEVKNARNNFAVTRPYESSGELAQLGPTDVPAGSEFSNMLDPSCGSEAFIAPGFDDEFAILQSVLLDSREWPGFSDDFELFR